MHDESHESGDTDSNDDDDRQWARLVIRRSGKQRCCDEALTAMAATMATIVTRLLCLGGDPARGAGSARLHVAGRSIGKYRCWWMATMLVRVVMLAMLAMMATIGVKCSNSDSIAWRGFGRQ